MARKTTGAKKRGGAATPKKSRNGTKTRPVTRSPRHVALSGPASPATNHLPLLDPAFDWERFEQFSHHFVSLQPGVVTAHRYGTQGSTQKGIDIAATLENTAEETYQCKRYT